MKKYQDLSRRIAALAPPAKFNYVVTYGDTFRDQAEDESDEVYRSHFLAWLKKEEKKKREPNVYIVTFKTDAKVTLFEDNEEIL